MRLQSCEKVMGWCTAQCKMLLFCVKTIVKESHNFELACLKTEKHLLILGDTTVTIASKGE